MTREQWLLSATVRLRDTLFKQADAIVPEVRVSVGFPGGARVSAHKAIGQYWPGNLTDDKTPQVFVSPVLGDPIRALDVLVHELVHACTPGSGHKGPFKRLAIKVGLEGKMTATVAGTELTKRLNALSEELGPYPHSAINLADRKKQGTRLGKIQCTSCGYTCRVTAKWIEERGTPLCPCSGEPMEVV